MVVYLVLVNVKQRILVVKRKLERPYERHLVELLKTKKGVEEFRSKVTNRFQVLEESEQNNEVYKLI